jgi:hypothetical protein
MIAKEEKVKLRGANGSPKTAGILSMTGKAKSRVNCNFFD